MTTGPGPGRPRARRQGPDGGSISVFVADEQDQEPVDAVRWSTLAEQVLVDEGVTGEAELSVLFVDEGHITDLNRRFMGQDGPTDVLSFPLDAVDADPRSSTIEVGPEVVLGGAGSLGTPPTDPDDQPLLLGDVVICPAVAARQAPEHAGTYDDEIALLLVHGILHVLGMDHAEAVERGVMRQREHDLLHRYHGAPARDPWSS